MRLLPHALGVVHVEVIFAPVNIQVIGYKLKSREDLENYIKWISDSYGGEFGVFAVVLPHKYRKALEKLLNNKQPLANMRQENREG